MSDSNKIKIQKAKVHNLKNVSLSLEKGKLIVFTGVSGSGKSSLAFDTIFAEGQRRYIEAMSHHARRHLGDLPKPDVEKITGLSPTIAIEQKTIGKTPRSTVGTLTGIYDYLRVLFAKVGVFHCPVSLDPVKPQSIKKITERISSFPVNTQLIFLAPFLKNKKGSCKDELAHLLKRGFLRVRIDKEIVELSGKENLNPATSHTIDLVIDRITVNDENRSRILEAVHLALEEGKGYFFVIEVKEKKEHTFSTFAYSQKSALSYGPLDPVDFSFNHPNGMCPTCQGLGIYQEFDLEKIIDPNLSIAEDCCKIASSYQTVRYGNIYQNLARLFDFKMTTPWKKLSKKAQKIFLYGTEEKWTKMLFIHPAKKIRWTEYIRWEGVLKEAHQRLSEAKSQKYKDKMFDLMTETICPKCHGKRIKAYPAATKIGGKTLYELVQMDLDNLYQFFEKLKLEKQDLVIANELIKEIKKRISFLNHVGLHYLFLDRTSPSLSGGESQRVRLAAQISSGLVGSIYVLDEPSIGLHAKDHHKLIDSLKNLRDRDNTLLVVEHDKETISQADIIVDVGPLAGKYGGEILSCGTLEDLLGSSRSLTAQYLRGEKTIAFEKRKKRQQKKCLKITGATYRNLQNITVNIPLENFVCITGVSGSGKSSLISDILYPFLSNHFHHSKLSVGKCKNIEGLQHLNKVIFVDQSPIGKTIRSNPATYIKILDDIRDLFAKLPESKIRGFLPGHFSFNVKEGSCTYCAGIGKVRIDMDFLEDVWTKCSQCEGKRFDAEILSIEYRGKTIFDILEMDIEEACIFFEPLFKIHRKLTFLKKVGLGYLKLGQPSPTLSGGEAQRVKLAKELVRPSTGETVYILDEPTTGLHFHDVENLIQILFELVENKNTVIVIEHNLDFIQCADWIIDLGPQGGKNGGKIDGEGTPDKIAKLNTATGTFLRKALKNEQIKKVQKHTKKPSNIVVEKAAQNNLKDVDITLPRNKISVFMGPSGSGKTSLAFDTIFAAGQRNYIETLPSYVRQFLLQMPKPKVENMQGLSPTIAIEQKKGSMNPRSTVGTLTEVYDLVRILYAHLGIAYCPETKEEIKTISKQYVCDQLMKNFIDKKIHILSPLYFKGESFEKLISKYDRQGFLRVRLNQTYYELDEKIPFDSNKKNELFLVIDRLIVRKNNEQRLLEAIEKAAQLSQNTLVVEVAEKDIFYNLAFAVESTGKSYPAITPQTFSFNSESGMCMECQGIGYIYGMNFKDYPYLMQLSVVDIFYLLLKDKASKKTLKVVYDLFKKCKIDPFQPLEQLEEKSLNAILKGLHSVEIKTKDGLRLRFAGLEKVLAKAAKRALFAVRYGLVRYMSEKTCPSCKGARLNPLAVNVKVNGLTIFELCNLTIEKLIKFFQKLNLSLQQKTLLKETLFLISKQLDFLREIGLNYLTLSRLGPTLSGGELQRIRLSKQLGSGLTNCIYVIDEPTIGMHPQNIQLLIKALKKLNELDNTLIIVEHDPSIIEMADFLADFGPLAGKKGGEILSKGSFKQVLKDPKSLTAAYLTGKKSIPLPKSYRKPKQYFHIKHAKIHNLKNIDLRIPVSVMTCITGVSGSGKSSLLQHIIEPGVRTFLNTKSSLKHLDISSAQLSNLDHFDKLIVIDQTPIHLHTRADVLTYTEISTHLRSFFSQLSLARAMGLQPKHFSYNHKKGMCRTCYGLGYKIIDLKFLPSVNITCDACKGFRLNPKSLEVMYKNKHFGKILQLSCDEAKSFFENVPHIYRRLDTLNKVGLGYVKLGQELNSLSSGEIQRIKLTKELSKRMTGKTLYLIDEPTKGLHFSDIEKILKIFHHLADKKNTLIFIEHHLDFIANCDHIIDLGPGAGENGGQIIGSGSVAQLIKSKTSVTGKYLKNTIKKGTQYG